jgi:hypothetical protein
MFIASWMSRAPAWWRGIGRRMSVKPLPTLRLGQCLVPLGGRRWYAVTGWQQGLSRWRGRSCQSPHAASTRVDAGRLDGRAKAAEATSDRLLGRAHTCLGPRRSRRQPINESWAGLVDRARGGLDIGTAQALVSINQEWYDMTGIVFGLTLLAGGVAILRGSAMSRWAGWVAVAIGIVLIASVPIGTASQSIQILGYAWFLAVGGFYTLRPGTSREQSGSVAQRSVTGGLQSRDSNLRPRVPELFLRLRHTTRAGSYWWRLNALHGSRPDHTSRIPAVTRGPTRT